MVRSLEMQVDDLGRDIKDNLQRIHTLRIKVDNRMYDGKPIPPDWLGELIQKEAVTADAARTYSGYFAGRPDVAISYRQLSAQLLGKVGADLITAGQVRQAQQYFDKAAVETEELEDALAANERIKREEMHGQGQQNDRGQRVREGYATSDNDRLVRRERTSDNRLQRRERRMSYGPAVGAIVAGIIIIFLMGMPGITGAAIGTVIKSSFSFTGLLIVLIGATWLVFREVAKKL